MISVFLLLSVYQGLCLSTSSNSNLHAVIHVYFPTKWQVYALQKYLVATSSTIVLELLRVVLGVGVVLVIVSILLVVHVAGVFFGLVMSTLTVVGVHA